MAIQDQFRIENDKANRGLKFSWGGNVTDTIQVNNVTASLASAAASSNIAIPLGGFKRLVSFDFRIANSGSNQGYNVTTTGAISNTTTLEEQWDFLMDTVMMTAGSDTLKEVTFTVQIYTGTTTKRYSGVLESIQLAPQDGNPYLEGSMTLFVGTNILA